MRFRHLQKAGSDRRGEHKTDFVDIKPFRVASFTLDIAKVFIRAQKTISKEDKEKLETFQIKPTAVQVKRVDAPLPDSKETRQSLEFYWRGKRDRNGHNQFCVLKAEADRKGNLVPGRTAVIYTS